MNKSYFAVFISALLLILLGAGCRPSFRPPALPDKDIVFQRYPVVDYEHSTVLGFINADGTGYEERELVKKSGALPSWSADGKAIFYRWWPPSTTFTALGSGYVGVAGADDVCRNELAGTGRLRPIAGQGNKVLTTVLEKDDYVHEIGLVDPITCQVLEIIYYFGRSEEIYLADPALSPKGLLALRLDNLYDDTESQQTIVVIDLSTKEKNEVGYGVGPSWSPDGQWLAYTARDGIYLVRPDGSERHRVVDYDSSLPVPYPSHATVWDNWPPYAEWSPDGKWLVYHLWEDGQYNIHKLNLESGKDVIIFQGGLYPHWRWTPQDE